jgi:Co/Zn/Cd efflux system component
MMVAEIVAGNMFGSMALTADGWHMSMHAAAMLIAALAYHYARKHSGTVASPSAVASSATLPVLRARSYWP